MSSVAASMDAPIHFILASCQYPAGVLDGGAPHYLEPFLTHPAPGPADRSLARAAELCDGTPESPAFALLAGDQVYVDATAGLFDPGVLADALRIAYERREDSQGWSRLRGKAQHHLTLFDDHELRDNWCNQPMPFIRQRTDVLQQAIDMYWTWQRTGLWPYEIVRGPTSPLWDDAVAHGLPFFMADTRSEREARTPALLASARIMSVAQTDALHGWIAAHARQAGCPPRFLASSSIVLPRRLATRDEPSKALYEDAWPGYAASLHGLLAALCDHQAHNIVLLSGDEHQGCITKLAIRCDASGTRAQVYSVHAPALYAPYPFASSTPDDLAQVDTLCFVHGGQQYVCEVDTWFPPAGDGFATVRTMHDDAGWWLSASYDLASGLFGPGPLRLDA